MGFGIVNPIFNPVPSYGIVNQVLFHWLMFWDAYSPMRRLLLAGGT
jgi:hypothetical protein